MVMSLSKLWEIVKGREAWRATVHDGGKESDMTELLDNKQRYKGENRCVTPRSPKHAHVHKYICTHTETHTHTNTGHIRACAYTHTEFIICLVGKLSAPQFLTFLLPAFIQ